MFESLYSVIYTPSIISEEYSVEFKMNPHEHSTLEIAYVLSGILEIRYFADKEKENYQSCFYTAGQFALIKPKVKHYNVIHSDNTRLMVAEFISKSMEGDLLAFVKRFSSLQNSKSLNRIIDAKEKVMVFTDTDKALDSLKSLFYVIREHKENQDDELFEFAYNTALRQLCLAVLRCKSPSVSWQGNVYVNKCWMFIKEHYARDIDLKIIATYIGVTPSYLQRMFRLATGKTIMRAVTEERMAKAKYLLLYTEKTVHDIAVQRASRAPISFISIFFPRRAFPRANSESRIIRRSIFTSTGSSNRDFNNGIKNGQVRIFLCFDRFSIYLLHFFYT